MLINAVEDYFSRGFKVIPVHLELDKNNDKKAFFGILWKKEKECITENRVKNLIKNSISGYPSSKTGEPFKLKYNALGLLTGQASNLLVLDVDLGEVNGHDTLRREQIEIPPGTPSVKTQSGGQHFYFSFPEELKDVKTTRSFGAEYHIDIRGDGGLVFVPPSKINDENFYSWVVLLDGDAPPPPKKLIEFVLKHSTHAVKAVGEVPEINFSKKSTDELPITRYNHDTNACLECEGLLLSAGWQRVGNSDKWTRPGKA